MPSYILEARARIIAKIKVYADNKGVGVVPCGDSRQWRKMRGGANMMAKPVVLCKVSNMAKCVTKRSVFLAS